MSKINILDSSVFNKIAAGEVVEKPASVVKELLDNALDAGANKICVSIVDGGIKNITISDNGSGIEPDDFSKVFVAHATSKIKTADDLANIGTLGFRGEALASIASVSKIKLTSKIATETFARFCEVEGGTQTELQEIGAENGTTISVSDLFFNVPARAKFLRKPKTEMAEITNIIERYILCHPTIAFTYIADDKTIYQSTGTNLLDAIYIVYGKSAVDGVIAVDSYNSNSKIKISGYIGLPTFSKPNRTYQTLSINGRFVNSPLVSTCVYNAYEHFLMKSQFPFYVLNLEIPFDRLDVNVHPSKMEVRFNNTNEIYGNVFNAVSTALTRCDKISSVSEPIGVYKQVETGRSFQDLCENTEQNNAMQTSSVEIDATENNAMQNDFETKKESENTAKTSLLNSMISSGNIDFSTGEMHQSSPVMSKLINSQIEQTLLSETKFDNSPVAKKTRTEQFFDEGDVKFVGEIFATYLIIEKQQKVYVIDEHAGHERLLFDRLVKQVDAQQVTKQALLVPFNISLNMQEFEFVDSNLDKLRKLGFDIEQFGAREFIITSIPSILADINLNDFFAEILKDLSNMKTLKQSDLVLRKLMQHSCKCAVRAGKILSSGEVNALITQMKEEKMQLQCPHGRPVVVELSKSEIEKWFKRIV